MTKPVSHLRLELRVLPMRTRMPFRYGIATLQALPHLFVFSEVEVNGQISAGVASDGLPPKWFNKNPATSIEQDLVDMIAVIQNAARLTPLLANKPLTFFEFWRDLQKEVDTWAYKQGFPPLLAQLGVSLVERSILDAMCKAQQKTLRQMVWENQLHIDLGSLHGALKDLTPAHYLNPTSSPTTWIRHTIGMGDPLTDKDVPAGERLDDGLPQTLQECITTYGLRYFKIKLSGKIEQDTSRLEAIGRLIHEHCGDEYRVTLDGNENFTDIHSFRDYFTHLQRNDELKELLNHNLWVEQPLHRNTALSDSVATALADWRDAPALIIDESDSSLADVIKALQLGYSGVSHKNCKGIVKGIAKAALIHHYQRLHPKRAFYYSGEDLANVGPVALTQDLAMQSLLGIQHVERNGHHYFKGLSMFSQEINEAILTQHADLYRRHEDGFATLNIQQGKIQQESVNQAPFGCGINIDSHQFLTVKEWIMQGGMAEVV